MFQFLPVYEDDIFLQYRPFPTNPTNNYQAHWHEILTSFIFYTSLQYASHKISPLVLGSTYTSFSKKTRINFDIHMVSMVQCIISILLLVPTINHPYYVEHATNPLNSVLGYTPYGGFVTSVTLGYFIWDTLVCLRYFRLFGPGFLFHGVAAAYVFGSGLKPFCLPWIPAFLAFELSTPFVNINWFANRLPKDTFPKLLVTINGILLLVTFFGVRIVWGFYAVFQVGKDMFAVGDKVHWVFPYSILGLNVFLNVLNVYWFGKMLAIAKKTVSGRKAKVV